MFCISFEQGQNIALFLTDGQRTDAHLLVADVAEKAVAAQGLLEQLDEVGPRRLETGGAQEDEEVEEGLVMRQERDACFVGGSGRLVEFGLDGGDDVGSDGNVEELEGRVVADESRATVKEIEKNDIKSMTDVTSSVWGE